MIVIELAGPARGKGAARATNTPNGPRVYTDARTRKYEAQLRFAAQQVMGAKPATDRPVRVWIEVRVEVPRSWSKKAKTAALSGDIYPVTRPDVENFAKSMDGLNGVVWLDDKQIVHETISKVYSAQPGLTILVEPIEPGKRTPLHFGRPPLPASIEAPGPLFMPATPRLTTAKESEQLI